MDYSLANLGHTLTHTFELHHCEKNRNSSHHKLKTISYLNNSLIDVLIIVII